MNIQFNRQINTNRWMIKARWFYAATVLFIGFLSKTISQSNVNFPMAAMISFFSCYLIFNLIFIYLLSAAEKKNSRFILSALSHGQISLELIFTTIIMHYGGGIESISMVFFFLPVVMSALIFRARGSIITAVISGLIINLLVVAEYAGIIPHVSRYSSNTLEYLNLYISLTKTVTVSIFYLVVGFYVGYGANLLYTQEKLFEEKVRLLEAQTKQLQAREAELNIVNEERDKKVHELEKFKKQVVGRELDMIELKNKIKELEGDHTI